MEMQAKLDKMLFAAGEPSVVIDPEQARATGGEEAHGPCPSGDCDTPWIMFVHSENQYNLTWMRPCLSPHLFPCPCLLDLANSGFANDLVVRKLDTLCWP